MDRSAKPHRLLTSPLELFAWSLREDPRRSEQRHASTTRPSDHITDKISRCTRRSLVSILQTYRLALRAGIWATSSGIWATSAVLQLKFGNAPVVARLSRVEHSRLGLPCYERRPSNFWLKHSTSLGFGPARPTRKSIDGSLLHRTTQTTKP